MSYLVRLAPRPLESGWRRLRRRVVGRRERRGNLVFVVGVLAPFVPIGIVGRIRIDVVGGGGIGEGGALGSEPRPCRPWPYRGQIGPNISAS